MLESLSFEQAIVFTTDILSRDHLSDIELQEAIANLVSTDNGARGFFVAYLTSEIANQHSEAIVQAIRHVPVPSAELLVKNLAMSTAMAIAHRRNQNESLALGSDQVRDRTASLINRLKLAEVQRVGNLMQLSAQSGVGEYASFLTKWGYDAEQRRAIATIISTV